MCSNEVPLTMLLKVKCEEVLPPSAVMAITGNIDELGHWDPQSCLPMECISKTGDGEIWLKEFTTKQATRKMEFRYAMIIIDEVMNQRLVKILKWETRLKPRTLYFHEVMSRPEPELHIFGKYGGETKLQRGWLTQQTEVHLRVYGDSFKWFKPRHRGRRAYLRVLQLRVAEEATGQVLPHPDNEEEQSLRADDEETNDSNFVPSVTLATVSCLGVDAGPRAPDLGHFQGAIQHTEKDFHTFRLQTWDLPKICVEVDVFVGSRLEKEREDEPILVGTARVPPFERLQGVKWLHIYGNNRKVIGQVKIDFLVILPLRDMPLLMDVSYAKYWKFIRTLTIGHRGSGSDVGHSDKETTLKENTLSSLRSAFEHGADYVEFDVHLSKDKVPIVYHDFTVALTLRKKKRGDLRYVKVAVKDLTLEELQNLKVSHSAVLNTTPCPESMAADQSDTLDTLAFLTLAQLFEHFDRDDDKMGFNIEVKYPLPMENGEHEMENYFERNECVDIILKVIIKMAGQRRILLSSFDPDICTLISLKQNRYPVVLLTQGINSVYPAYQDLRTLSHTIAIYHAIETDILGVNLFCEELLRNPRPILSLARSKKLVVILWGEELNKNSVQEQLKALGLDGLVFDRVHEHNQKGHPNVFRSAAPGAWPSSEIRSCFAFNSTACSSESMPSPEANSEEGLSSISSDVDLLAPADKHRKVDTVT